MTKHATFELQTAPRALDYDSERSGTTGDDFDYFNCKDPKPPISQMEDKPSVEEGYMEESTRPAQRRPGSLLLIAAVTAVVVALIIVIPVSIVKAKGDTGDMKSTMPQTSPAPG